MGGLISVRVRGSIVEFLLDDEVVVRIREPSDGELGVALLLMNLIRSDKGLLKDKNLVAKRLKRVCTSEGFEIPLEAVEKVINKIEIVNGGE